MKTTLEHLGLSSWNEDPAFGNNPARIKEFFDVIVPLISSDQIIEARQTQNLDTITDSLVDIERKMMNWEGSTQDPSYQSLVKQRAELIGKMAR